MAEGITTPPVVGTLAGSAIGGRPVVNTRQAAAVEAAVTKVSRAVVPRKVGRASQAGTAYRELAVRAVGTNGEVALGLASREHGSPRLAARIFQEEDGVRA